MDGFSAVAIVLKPNPFPFVICVNYGTQLVIHVSVTSAVSPFLAALRCGEVGAVSGDAAPPLAGRCPLPSTSTRLRTGALALLRLFHTRGSCREDRRSLFTLPGTSSLADHVFSLESTNVTGANSVNGSERIF